LRSRGLARHVIASQIYEPYEPADQGCAHESTSRAGSSLMRFSWNRGVAGAMALARVIHKDARLPSALFSNQEVIQIRDLAGSESVGQTAILRI
jgi:hypothetical protein